MMTLLTELTIKKWNDLQYPKSKNVISKSLGIIVMCQLRIPSAYLKTGLGLQKKTITATSVTIFLKFEDTIYIYCIVVWLKKMYSILLF